MNVSRIISSVFQVLRYEPLFLTERPLIPYFISLAGGMLFCDFRPISWLLPLSILFLTLAGFFLSFRFQMRRTAFLSLHGSVFLTGFLCMLPYAGSPSPVLHPHTAPNAEKAVYRGFIDAAPDFSPDKVDYTLSGVRLSDRDHEAALPGRILLSARIADRFQYGDYIQFRARLAVPRNFNNPGGFDYRMYLRRKQIHYRATVSNPGNMILIRRDQGSPLKQFIESYRTQLRDFVGRHATTPEREIMLAMILGEQKSIPDDLRDRFNRTGTSHIIAISGFNVGLIAFFSVLLTMLMLKSVPRLLLTFNAAKVSYALALIPILLFTVIAGMGTPVVRATIMVVILMTALMIRKPKDIFNALPLAAIIIVALWPPALYDPSFQLSFAAVASILFIPPRLQPLYPGKEGPEESRLRAFFRKAGKAFYLFLLVTISATLGTIPIIAYHFQQISSVVIPANIAIVPFLGILTTPLCLLIIVMYPLSEALCLILVQCAGYLIQISVFFVNFFSSLPGAFFLTPPPKGTSILAYYTLLFSAVMLVTPLIKKKTPGVSPGNRFLQQRIALPTLLLFLSFYLLYSSLSASPAQYLRLTMIDVGQGSSALVQFPRGEVMLIDGGGFEGSRFDTGRYVVSPFLLREKVRKIDYIVLTHPHPDHLNGLLYIVRHFPVGEIWSNGDHTGTETYRAWLDVIRDRGIPHRILNRSTPPLQIGDTDLLFFNPPEPLAAGMTSCDDKKENNRSLVFQIRYRQATILVTGDIEKETEAELAAGGHDLKSRILLVPHHGSRTSSTEAFLVKVDPEAALISCGDGNRYKMPHKEALARLEARGAQIFRTDLNGAVSLVTDGETVRWRQQMLLPAMAVENGWAREVQDSLP